MSDKLRQTIYQALTDICLIDPHTHINPHTPASSTLADLLGYHYYTELAHSSGMQRERIEEPGLLPREKVRRLVAGLEPLENTIQYSWLIDICRRFFGFEGSRLTADNWEAVYDAAEQKMQFAEWPDTVLQQSNVEAVFLTNDFDDDLAGFDSHQYIPCLRTDDLVFHLAKPEVRDRLTACSGIEVRDLSSLRAALEQRFEHFVSRGARACAISLPPGFTPHPVADGRAATALDAVLQDGVSARDAQRDALSRRVFWTLAELCDHHGLPFDLMIGVNRGVYPSGVFQGQDLYDSRVSLIQYQQLFNAFPQVKFPISVLASVTNQELVSYAWIFPNVITNGHWWYSNTPSFIERDAAARLEAVPQTKQIGYYSDAYKLEFVAPKFDMYRRILAKVLSESFVIDRGWSEEQAIELGRKVLRGNVELIFPDRQTPAADAVETIDDDALDVDAPQSSDAPESSAGPAAGLAAAVVAPALGEVSGVFMEQAPQTEATPDEAPLAEESPAEETPDDAPLAEESPVDESPVEETIAFDEQLELADEQDDAGLWGDSDPLSNLGAAAEDESDAKHGSDLADVEDESDAKDDGDGLSWAPELAETVESPGSDDLTVNLDEPSAEADETDGFPTAELAELPTVVEQPAPPQPAPQPLFDADLEATDEQDDADLWGQTDDDAAPLTLMEDLPTTVEEPLAAQPDSDTSDSDTSDSDTSDSEPPAIAFDQELEDADEQDDALLWSDDDEGELTLEAPSPEPPDSPLPTLEEYQPLNDSGTSLIGDQDDNDNNFGMLSDGSSLSDDGSSNDDEDADGKQ